MYCTLTVILANLPIYYISSLFYISRTKFRDLYNIIKTEPGLKILSEWYLLIFILGKL